jgi:hypothetical protein
MDKRKSQQEDIESEILAKIQFNLQYTMFLTQSSMKKIGETKKWLRSKFASQD